MTWYRASCWLDGQDYFVIPYEAATVQEAVESASDACYQAIVRLEVDQGKTWTRFARAVREAVSGLLDDVGG